MARTSEEVPVLRSVGNKSDVVTRLREHQSGMTEFGVRTIGIFGSFARDEATVDSDIDVLVEFEPEQKTFDNFMNLSFFLEDILQRRVELVTTSSLSPHIGPRILASVEYVTEPA